MFELVIVQGLISLGLIIAAAYLAYHSGRAAGASDERERTAARLSQQRPVVFVNPYADIYGGVYEITLEDEAARVRARVAEHRVKDLT